MLLALVLPALAGPLLNEVLYDPAGSDTTANEWVELCNPGGVAINLAGYELWRQGSSASKVATIASGTLPAFGYVLIGGTAGSPLATLTDTLYNGGSNSYGVVLKAPGGSIVDAMFYDTGGNGALLDENASVPTSFAADVPEAHSLARWPDCADTNASASDWRDYATPSPGAANPQPASTGTGTGTSTGTATNADCTNASGLTINEFAIETGKEFVEIHNGGSGSVNLRDWELQFGTKGADGYNKHITLTSGTLAAGQHFVIATLATTNPNQVSDLTDLGNATSNADAMRLSCNGTAVDTVVYGKSATANATEGWDDDLGADTTSMSPVPGSGKSAARVQDGFDTDRSGADFIVGTPTPGAANPRVEPAVCENAAGSRVVINEFIYNPAGTDGDLEWVELYNAGTAVTRLDGWVIETATETWGEDFVFPNGTSLAPNEYLVVGGPAVAASDLVSEDLSLGNGSSSADGVRIKDCLDAVVDTILYGKGDVGTLTGDGGSTTVVPEVEDGASLGRYPDGTDENAPSDFMEYATPTPGRSNPESGSGGGTGTGGAGSGAGDDPAASGGCNGDAPTDETRPDGGGCGTVLPLGGLEVAMAAAALLRRRRR
jgi:hypothetical protein